MNWDSVKESIGLKAAYEHVSSQETIGLGTGTTAKSFIQALGERCSKENLNIQCIATSQASHSLAIEKHIPIIDLSQWSIPIDATYDGADFIEIESGIAIKGLGGALLREKIVAASSSRLFIMVDERKVLPRSGTHAVTLPLEVAPFGVYMTQRHLKDMGNKHGNASFQLRMSPGKQQPFITDNGNYIIDASLTISWDDLILFEQACRSIPGVLETGLFSEMATDILIGYANGEIEHRRFSLR